MCNLSTPPGSHTQFVLVRVLPMVWKAELKFVLSVPKIAISATAVMAAIRPYSIAVAPDSSAANRLMRFFTIGLRDAVTLAMFDEDPSNHCWRSS